MVFTLSKETELTPTIIKRVIDLSRSNVGRMEMLHDYYIGNHKILGRQMQDTTKPNNKVVNPFPSYISDTLTGYFVGKPISYNATDDATLEKLNLILGYNDAAAEDAELALDASVYGVGYELLYVDEDGNVRFKKLNPQEVIIIYDDTIEKDIIYAIRVIKNYDLKMDRTTYKVDVYSDLWVRHYDAGTSISTLNFIAEEPHYFGMVPLVEYKNNEDEIGDFETIIPLIDAYDKLESDSLNDYEAFVDSYLVLKGMDADADDIKTMRENRVLLLDSDDASAEWLTKNENSATTENIKSRIENDIHKFSKCPNLSDKEFSSNASGIAIKFKLYGTETLVSKKEREFKKGLQRRLELIFAITNLKSGANDNYLSVEIMFSRNIPANDTEIADMVQKLSGIVSRETLLSRIPWIENVQAEVKKLDAESQENPFYDYLGTTLPADGE